MTSIQFLPMISLRREDDHTRTLIRIKGMISNYNALAFKRSLLHHRKKKCMEKCGFNLPILFVFVCSTLLKAYSVACILLCSITVAENTYFSPISLWLKIMLLRISSQLSLEKHCRYFWWVHQKGSLNVSSKLPTYPSLRPRLTLASHLRQIVGLGEG